MGHACLERISDALHGTEGHEICEAIKNESEGILSGPIMTDRSKPELRSLSMRSPGILSSNGVCTAIITDHPETPVHLLLVCAAVAVKGGMSRVDALRAVTINPARICGIDDRVGSIEKGKDADLVIYKGDPLDVTNSPSAVFAGGRIVVGGE